MPKAIRFLVKLLSTLIALGVILCALVLGAAVYFNSPPAESVDAPDWEEEGMRLEEDGALLLEVKSGESAYSVGKRLENSGVIRSGYFWYFLFRLDSAFIKTGVYRIELPVTQTRLRSILTSGDQLLVKVTVPEGITLKKTAKILEEAGICGAEDFLAASSSAEILAECGIPGTTAEGFLYPETYLFPLSYPAQKVVSVMADMFFSRLKEIEDEASGAGNSALRENLTQEELRRRVIIASIVEREYRIPEEAAVMAGVFYKRLDIGMALQSCATVEYIITEIQDRPHPDVLYNRDLEIRDPYNTYMYPGLPPGPIAAPGETALRAAFAPAPTDYLYFRLVDLASGRHYFSRSFDDHIKAGALYVKGR